MTKYIKLVQDLLNESKNWQEVKETYNFYLKADSVEHHTKYSCIERVINSFGIYQQSREGLQDVLAALRQVGLIAHQCIRIKESFYHEIESFVAMYGIRPAHIKDGVELYFERSYPNWLGAGEEIKQLYEYKKETTQEVLGDTYLYHATGYTHYTSQAQKYIVQLAMQQEPGTTLMAALRTGGGKSLIFQLPTYYESTGATIVIVPTVALAIDQVKGAEKLFEGRKGKPYAIHSGIEEVERKIIEEKLKKGKIPLLYTSPEVAMGKWFKEVLFDLAQRQLINRLVIDEAHIIDEWGDFFRVDFQVLALLRRRLLELSGGQLRTVLLSATLSEQTTMMLKELFSEPGHLIEVRADDLRKELMYYYCATQGEARRKQYFRELLPVLPRPFIAYVGTREQAQNYYELIREAGYLRVALFTGETSTNKRDEIIDAWSMNKIDIIVATCAFGVGVDKKDVRAVVHLYLPPSIDRYYQEVGRGGRDGYPSLAVSLVYHLEDYKLISNLTNSKVLTTENLVDRWQAMLRQSQDRQGGDELLVNTRTNPGESEYVGTINANWNAYVILFLTRNGYIDILDVEAECEKKYYQFRIKIKNLLLDDSKEQMIHYLDQARDKERTRIDEQIEQMKRLMKAENTKCWGTFFQETYPYAQKSCRTCPTCRKMLASTSFNRGEVEVTEGRQRLLTYLKERKIGVEIIDVKEKIYELDEPITKFSEALIGYNQVDILIVSDKSLVDLSQLTHEKQIYVYTYEEILSGNDMIYRGRICILFNEESNKTNQIFEYFNARKNVYTESSYIYLVKKGLKITQYNKELVNLVEGPIYQVKKENR